MSHTKCVVHSSAALNQVRFVTFDLLVLFVVVVVLWLLLFCGCCCFVVVVVLWLLLFCGCWEQQAEVVSCK
jgi:uncharacterized membrane protein